VFLFGYRELVVLQRTVSVIVQVGELVTPLGDDAQGILEEGDDDEESANRRDITVAPANQQPLATSRETQKLQKNSRLDGMRQGIEPVFNLAGLFTNGIQRTGIVGGVWSSGPAERRGLRAQVVSCCPSDLSHGFCCGRMVLKGGRERGLREGLLVVNSHV
jgi:hypothetical protein